MRERARSVVLGISRLARGRADGMAQFGDTPQAFLASLAPLLAFPLVGGLRLLLAGRVAGALLVVLASCVALLAPPVLSHALARLWDREAAWSRYATAFNWCHWATLLAAMALLLVLGPTAAGGAASGGVFVLALSLYTLWLQAFLARHGLGVSWPRALAVVLVTNAGSALLVFGPLRLVGGAP